MVSVRAVGVTYSGHMVDGGGWALHGGRVGPIVAFPGCHPGLALHRGKSQFSPLCVMSVKCHAACGFTSAQNSPFASSSESK